MAEAEVSDVALAVAAATATASGLGLAADEAIVLHESNRLAIRLLPSDVLARVAPAAHQAAQFEVDLASWLARTGAPVAPLDPRVPPRVYEHDGFTITLWTYYASESSRGLAPGDYADALQRLHVGLREVDVSVPHFTDRVKEAEELVANRDRSADVSDADRDLLTNTLTTAIRAIRQRGAPAQQRHCSAKRHAELRIDHRTRRVFDGGGFADNRKRRVQNAQGHLRHVVGRNIVRAHQFQNGINRRLHIPTAGVRFDRRRQDFKRRAQTLRHPLGARRL